jgi:glycosyltransferase involved in cell wall biosynthesis
MRQRSVAAIVSVTAGTYFLGASLAARWTKKPLILIVHDDWVPIVSKVLPVPQGIFHRLLGSALRSASQVFVVSAGMQRQVKALYGVDSEIQMPATDPWPTKPSLDQRRPPDPFRILYMGNGASAQDSLMLLVNMVRSKALSKYGLDNVELHLCMPAPIEDSAIKNHGWVMESEARRQIEAADLVFLPYGFTAEDHPVAVTSFPAKSADYFASGKPILVLGPKDSTIVEYAEAFDCAAVVSEFDEDAVAKAICRIAGDRNYRERLSANARKAFAANHDIRRQHERLFEVVRTLSGMPTTVAKEMAHG